MNRRAFFKTVAGAAAASRIPVAPAPPAPISGISISRKFFAADEMLISPAILSVVGGGRTLFNPAIDVNARYEEARKVILARIGASH